MSSFEEFKIEEDFCILKGQNQSDKIEVFERKTPFGFIQFHYNLKGLAKFNFNNNNYFLTLPEEKSLLLYNPQKYLPIAMELQPNSWVISLLISVKKLHKLISNNSQNIPFFDESFQDKKLYKEEDIKPSLAIVLNQIFHYKADSIGQNLYLKAKGYELMSLYFYQNEETDKEKCPFLLDEDNVQKIKKAKDIMIKRMAEPPSLNELADEVGLNLKKLKTGFKEIYGSAVYQFLFDYKIEYARKLLDEGSHNVNEVGLMVGYSTSSHFIAAFKKKYGTTPKKYLMSLETRY